MVILSSTMQASQLEYLLICETSHEMWKKLSSLHEQKSETNKLYLMSRFHDYKMASSDTVAQHFAKIENMVRQLTDLGENVSDITIMAKVLNSLPAKYSAFVTAWESANQTLDRLRERLVKEESRMTILDETTGALAAMSTTSGKNEQKTLKKQKIRSKKDMTCHYCQKPGHFQKNCFKKKKESQASEEKSKAHGSTNEAFAAKVPTNQILDSATQDVWLLDSGPSKHMTFCRDWLSNMEPCDNEEVSLGDGGVCKVLGRGTVYIKTYQQSVARQSTGRRTLCTELKQESLLCWSMY